MSVSRYREGRFLTWYMFAVIAIANACNPGRYSFNKTCVDCPIGNYCPGDLRFYPCAPGTWCPFVGQLTALPCFPGYYCPGRSNISLTIAVTHAEPTQLCPPGRLCNEAGTILPRACPIGSFCPNTTLLGLPCLQGFTCNQVNASEANAICSIGSYCPAPGANVSFHCPTGHICANEGSVQPLPCTSGTVCNATQMISPQNCPTGTVCKSIGMTNVSLAAPCPVGNYCPEGSWLPLRCPVGSYCGEPYLSAAVPCPPGHICHAHGLLEPLQCIAGSNCSLPGAIMPLQSVCEPGYVCPPAQAPKECDAGYYCGAGQSEPHIQPCPTGSSCLDGSKSPVSCGLHYFAGTRQRLCRGCDYNTFTWDVGASECRPCNGTTVATTCEAPVLSWRSHVFVVSENFTAGVDALLLEVENGARVPCQITERLSRRALRCTLSRLPYTLTEAATAQVVVIKGSRSWPLRLSVRILPLPAMVFEVVSRTTLASRTLGFALPFPALTLNDWIVGIESPPAAALGQSSVRVWIEDEPCTGTSVTADSRRVFCTVPPAVQSNVVLPVVVELMHQFNLSGLVEQQTGRPPLVNISVTPVALTANGLIADILSSDICKGGGRLWFHEVSLCGMPCEGALQCDGNHILRCEGWRYEAVLHSKVAAETEIMCSMHARISSSEEWFCEDCARVLLRPNRALVLPERLPPHSFPIMVVGNNLENVVTLHLGDIQSDNITRIQGVREAVMFHFDNIPAVSVGSTLQPAYVENILGGRSESVLVQFPSSFSAFWDGNSHEFLVGAAFATVLPLRVGVTTRSPAKCTLAFDRSSIVCQTNITSAMLLAVLSSALTIPGTDGLSAVTTYTTLPNITFGGSSGCYGDLYVRCTDINGRIAVSPTAVRIRVLPWNASWADNTPMNLITAPGQLQHLYVSVQAPTNTFADMTALRCIATLWDVEGGAQGGDGPRKLSISISEPYQQTSSYAFTHVFRTLIAEMMQIGRRHALRATCTGQDEQNKVDLPEISVIVPNISVSIDIPREDMLAYESMIIHSQIVASAPLSLSPLHCKLRVVNATSPQIRVLVSHVNTSSSGYPSYEYTYNFTVRYVGGPSTWADVAIACTVWAPTFRVHSTNKRLSSAEIQTLLLSTEPEVYVPSDVKDPVPVVPQIRVKVYSPSRPTATFSDVTCKLDIFTPGIIVVPVGTASADDYTRMRVDDQGELLVPQFGLQPTVPVRRVALAIACKRDNGQKAWPVSFDLATIPIYSTLCNSPAGATLSGQPLAPFSVGFVLGNTTESSCTSEAAKHTLRQAGVERISCLVSPDGTYNSAAELQMIFTQFNVQEMSVDSMTTVFHTMTVFGPPATTFRFSISCTYGRLVLPTVHTFDLRLRGCPIGRERDRMFCVPCGDAQFSMGSEEAATLVDPTIPIISECTGCPVTGAKCAEGKLLLRQSYYRPPARAQEPYGPDTQLYRCLIAEACVVNVTSLTHSCAEGYIGPLCSVCDVQHGFGRRGYKCEACPPKSDSIFTLSICIAVVAAYLLYEAWKPRTTNTGKSTIILKIAIGYIQATGSLKSFFAGGTAVYRQIMQWTDVLSSTPLTAASLDCLWDLPHATMYFATLLLPIIAAALVAVAFHGFTLINAGIMQPYCLHSKRTIGVCEEIRRWWLDRRYISSTTFVFFLAYMGIVSSSLRVLDCYSPAIDGVVFLRDDMRVVCGSPEHVTTSIVAIISVVVIGAGFPFGIYKAVGRAQPENLVRLGFLQRWGFIFGGYQVWASERVSRIFHTQHMLWWEAVVLVRKFGLVIIAVLVRNAYMQNGLAAVWLGGFLLVHLETQPYYSASMNRLETFCLAATVTTAIISSMLLQNDVLDPEYLTLPADRMDPMQWLCTLAMLFLNITTMCVCLVMWIRALILENCDKCQRAKPVQSDPTHVVTTAMKLPEKLPRSRRRSTIVESIASSLARVKKRNSGAPRHEFLPTATKSSLNSFSHFTGAKKAETKDACDWKS